MRFTANVDVEYELTSNCEKIKKYNNQINIYKMNYLSLARRNTDIDLPLWKLLTVAIAVAATMSGNKDYKSATSIYDFTANSIRGEEVPLSK